MINSRRIRTVVLAALALPGAWLLALGPRADDDAPAQRVIVDYWEKWGGAEGAAMQEIVDAFKLRAPVFGSLFHKTALSRFSSTLAMLLRSGVPILQALEIVSDTVNNRVIGKAIADVQVSVRDGESIAKPLTKYPVFPPMVVQMISVGEETGQVDTMLEKIAQFYDQEVEASVDALTSLIEPILIAIIGGAVGAAVVALYMPMFNIIKLIK